MRALVQVIRELDIKFMLDKSPFPFSMLLHPAN
jgi:hypothetical protein